MPPVVHTLSQRLERMREGPADPGREASVDQELVAEVDAMVAAYLEMGCAEEPDSLECYYSEYSVFLLVESGE